MCLHQRKPNRIPDFDYSTDGIYFITICTDERKQVLCDIVGDGFPVPKPSGKIAREVIRGIPEKYPEASVGQYVIMPNHIHMLLRIRSGTGNPSPTLGAIVGWYKYQVTKQVNLLYGLKGERFFQRSYYDHVVRNELDYAEIFEYIENNPRKWSELKQTAK